MLRRSIAILTVVFTVLVSGSSRVHRYRSDPSDDSPPLARMRGLEDAIDRLFDVWESTDDTTLDDEACEVGSRTEEVYSAEDLSKAHDGLFRAIPWTREERLQISDLHSTQQYHLLGPLLRKKLNVLGSDPLYKHVVAKFFVEHYPPLVVRKLQDQESRCRIRQYLAAQNLPAALNVTYNRLGRLSPSEQNAVQSYIVANMRPASVDDAQAEAEATYDAK